MRVALWIYIAVYAALAVWSQIDPDPEETAADLILDAVLSSALLFGMVGYALRLDWRRVIAAWKFVAPLLVVGYVVQLIMLVSSEQPDPEMTVVQHRVLLAFAFVVVTMFVSPAFVINFRFARARHLP